VRTATFAKFNGDADALVAAGVRWAWRGQALNETFGLPEETLAMNLEPEYIALSAVRCMMRCAAPCCAWSGPRVSQWRLDDPTTR
jgi:hypothetical protein